MGTVYLVVNQTPTNTKNNKSVLAPKKIWTQEMEKDLIKLIKKERSLWEITNELINKRSYRFITWSKISNEMKNLWPNYEHLFTPFKIGKKFKNFRTYYGKELKRVKNDSNYISRWCHFEDLKFLESNMYVMQKLNHPPHGPPVIIQYPDGNRKSSKNVIKKNLKISSIKGKTKTPTIEEHMSNEEESSETSYKNAQSYSNLEEMFSNSKQKQLTVESVSNSPHFCNASQKTQMTHDEAFANFVAKDLAKIPEGIQKEELRFKIVELIHHCKIDANFLLN